jgi:hypothetical protein
MNRKLHALRMMPLSKSQQKMIKGGDAPDPDTDVVYVQCGRGQANGDWEVIPSDGYYDDPTDACLMHCGRQGVFQCMNWGQFNAV